MLKQKSPAKQKALLLITQHISISEIYMDRGMKHRLKADKVVVLNKVYQLVFVIVDFINTI